MQEKFDFIPQEDITAYELALCVKVIFQVDKLWRLNTIEEFAEKFLTYGIERHFVIIPPVD